MIQKVCCEPAGFSSMKKAAMVFFKKVLYIF